MPPIRVGLIGFGYAGSTFHAPLISATDGLHIAAVRQQQKHVSERALFEAVSSYCNAKNGGPIGNAEVRLRDDNGEDHLFLFESFYIRYRPPAVGEALTLGVYTGPVPRAQAV